MADANDPDPLPIEYISFGSYNTNLVKFYFNCSFSFATPDAVYDTTDHPLLAKDVPASIDLRNCMFSIITQNHNQLVYFCFPLILFFFSFSSNMLACFIDFLHSWNCDDSVLVTKCNYYSSFNYDYKHFVKLSDIKNSQPDGFILRIILYIQGARDGNIILATSDHPNFERDYLYEFGKYISSANICIYMELIMCLHLKSTEIFLCFFFSQFISQFLFHDIWIFFNTVIGGWGNELSYY